MRVFTQVLHRGLFFHGHITSSVRMSLWRCTLSFGTAQLTFFFTRWLQRSTLPPVHLPLPLARAQAGVHQLLHRLLLQRASSFTFSLLLLFPGLRYPSPRCQVHLHRIRRAILTLAHCGAGACGGLGTPLKFWSVNAACVGWNEYSESLKVCLLLQPVAMAPGKFCSSSAPRGNVSPLLEGVFDPCICR